MARTKHNPEIYGRKVRYRDRFGRYTSIDFAASVEWTPVGKRKPLLTEIPADYPRNEEALAELLTLDLASRRKKSPLLALYEREKKLKDRARKARTPKARQEARKELDELRDKIKSKKLLLEAQQEQKILDREKRLIKKKPSKKQKSKNEAMLEELNDLLKSAPREYREAIQTLKQLSIVRHTRQGEIKSYRHQRGAEIETLYLTFTRKFVFDVKHIEFIKRLFRVLITSEFSQFVKKHLGRSENRFIVRLTATSRREDFAALLDDGIGTYRTEADPDRPVEEFVDLMVDDLLNQIEVKGRNYLMNQVYSDYQVNGASFQVIRRFTSPRLRDEFTRRMSRVSEMTKEESTNDTDEAGSSDESSRKPRRKAKKRGSKPQARKRTNRRK